MDRPEDTGWGPVEWGIVVRCHQCGLDVRLEASGEVGMLDRMQSHDSYMRRNPEYLPDVGDRIRVRRMEARPGGDVRLVSFQTALNGWSEPEEVHERGFDVYLLASGETGTVMWSLVDFDRMFFSTDFHPVVGQPIRVRRLGVWPDGTLRLSHRKTFLDMSLDRVRRRHAEKLGGITKTNQSLE